MNILDNNPMQQQFDRVEHQDTPTPQPTPGPYTTHINELISEPATENIYLATAEYIFSSLFELSSYLFSKKIAGGREAQGQGFDSYLLAMGEELGKLGKARANGAIGAGREAVNIESELVRCYQKVESIYFEQKYCLDLSYFQLFYSELRSNNREERRKVDRQLEHLVQELDLVEINLFSQIHCKFQEYFAAAANFEYLQQSVATQLRKLAQSRQRLKRVKHQVVDKSVRLRQRIVQRQNIQRILKTIKVMRSIKKLPQVMDSILASSLPSDCIGLLQQTKASLDSVRQLHCLANTAESIKKMQAVAQNDLTKRHVNELYIYLDECQQVNLQQIWRRLQVRSCLDKDSSLIIDQLNSSSTSAQSEQDIILDQIQPDGVNLLKTKTSRLEEREYTIAMILLQSYQYITFTPEVIKIKVCNALRKYAKIFEREILAYLTKVVRKEIQARKDHEKVLEEPVKQEQEVINSKEDVLAKRQSEEEPSTEVVEKVTVEFYCKHLGVFNDIFRETIIRLLGYLETLVNEYEEQLGAAQQRGEEQTIIMEKHRKFKYIFSEECSMLPSIFKIIEEKLKYLLSLKNIRNSTAPHFYQWISILKYWQHFFDWLNDSSTLLNYKPNPSFKIAPLITELIEVVADSLKKAAAAMNLKILLVDLTVDYITAFHNNTLQSEVINTLQQDTWQSTEVPQEFSDILNNILNPDGTVLNASITILDSSASKSRENSRELSRQQGKSREEAAKTRIKFKLLKNNILVGGVRYKVNLSLIVLCETMAEYVKMSRVLSGVLPKGWVEEAGCNRVAKCVYQKLFDLLQRFCLKSKELILETKALQFGKIKGKNINAKHICLLCNCYSILIRLAEELLEPARLEAYSLTPNQLATTSLLENTHAQLTNKLALILNSKVEKDIGECIAQEKTNPAISTKTNTSLITAFLQMVEITDDYLEIQDIKKVLRPAFQTLSQKYFTHLLLKGEKFKGDVELLAQKLKFLRKYFPIEYESLLKEIPS